MKLSTLLEGATFLDSDVYLGTWFVFMMIVPSASFYSC